jgi:hypothetical protein
MSEDGLPAAEWRDLIVRKLETLERGQNEIRAELSVNFVRRADCNYCREESDRGHAEIERIVEKLGDRVKAIEELKARAVGAFFVVQFVVGLAFYLLDKFTRT